MVSGISGIAASGLALQEMRFAASADAVANVSTEGYEAKRVDSQESAVGGVRGRIVNTGERTSLINERVNQISTVAAYRANLSVIRTDDEMTGSLLDTFA